MERRLSAILAADVVGYSRLMEQDEADTFKRLSALRKEILEEAADAAARVLRMKPDWTAESMYPYQYFADEKLLPESAAKAGLPVCMTAAQSAAYSGAYRFKQCEKDRAKTAVNSNAHSPLAIGSAIPSGDCGRRSSAPGDKPRVSGAASRSQVELTLKNTVNDPPIFEEGRMGSITERRLAAILAADVVGYSRLVEVDEARTLSDLKNLRQTILEPLLEENRGRVVKLMGDGIIVEFSSVVAAITCAAAIQSRLTTTQEDSAPERRIILRIGVHLGDVIVEGEDLLGDGVNIAARLEQLCLPGGVLISGAAYEQLAGKVSLPFVDAGEKRLRNITRPIRAFQLAPERDDVWKPPEPLLDDKPAVAVLPFENLSNAVGCGSGCSFGRGCRSTSASSSGRSTMKLQSTLLIISRSHVLECCASDRLHTRGT